MRSPLPPLRPAPGAPLPPRPEAIGLFLYDPGGRARPLDARGRSALEAALEGGFPEAALLFTAADRRFPPGRGRGDGSEEDLRIRADELLAMAVVGDVAGLRRLEADPAPPPAGGGLAEALGRGHDEAFRLLLPRASPPELDRALAAALEAGAPGATAAILAQGARPWDRGGFFRDAWLGLDAGDPGEAERRLGCLRLLLARGLPAEGAAGDPEGDLLFRLCRARPAPAAAAARLGAVEHLLETTRGWLGAPRFWSREARERISALEAAALSGFAEAPPLFAAGRLGHAEWRPLRAAWIWAVVARR